jgi:LacI family transcriptional regulator
MARSTIEDVARLAGVSTATVSRVLTGSVPVSAELRMKVQSAADDLEYSVNVTARALRRDRTSAVGMILPDLSNPFFTLLVDGIERRIQPLGMSLLLCSSHNDSDLEARRVRSLQGSQVEVLIVAPVHVLDSGKTLRTVQRQLPLIQLDQFADDVESDWVGIDEERGMRMMLEHLAAEGVRTASYIGAVLTDSSARARYQAARAVAADLGIELSGDKRLLGTFSVDWGRHAAGLIASGALPDAVVCGADVIAFGVLEGFDSLGIRVPEDVLVTGFDDIALSSHPRLSITTVRQPIDEIAENVVEILSEILSGAQDRPVRQVPIEPELIVRSSSRKKAVVPS